MTAINYRHGAHPVTPQQTRFSLWAPDAAQVAVEFENGERHPLSATADGWFSATLTCAAGTRYQLLINEHLRVPDPAARAQVDDVHGWSYVVDHQQYEWQHTSWRGRPWHQTVLYEMHIGLLGGYTKAREHLPALVELGVTAVEFMPLAEFPGARNWGYDGTLPFAPEASYGTPDELKALIDYAHELGLMVFIDVVYNHFGPDGNYLSQYASAFFREDVQTPWGPAIDFRQAAVRDFFCENALMWVLDYRVDGLRLDAVHAIVDQAFLPELAQRVRAAVGSDRHLYLVLENEDNRATLLQQGFDAQWNDDGHNILHVMLTGENEGYYADFIESPTQKLARFLSEGFIYQGETTRRGHTRGEASGYLPPTAFVLFLQNHDQTGNRAFGERLITLAHPDALRAATSLLLLGPMVPLLFMGEEWGSRQPFFYFTDHHGELAAAVREGRRNEFTEFSIFNNAEMRDQIPDPNAPETFEQSQLEPASEWTLEQQDWYEFYRRLLQVRHTFITPRLQQVRALGATMLAERAVSAEWLLADNTRLRIDINLDGERVKATPGWEPCRQIFSCGVDADDYQQSVLPPRSMVAFLDSSDLDVHDYE
jgi:maltooligosyltrehalose trehalohydrolase